MNNDFKKNKKVRLIIFAAVIILIVAASAGSGYLLGKVSSGQVQVKIDKSLYPEYSLPKIFQDKLMSQVWAILRSEYVRKEQIDEKKLYYGALKGFVAGVGDPYTAFLDPDITKQFEDQISGEFQGIGAEIGIKDGFLTIISPLPDTPALRAGIKSGDRIYAIDGKETLGMSLEEAVKMIRGDKGTVVTLLIGRSAEEPKEYKIARDIIEIKSVEWSFRDDNIAYLKISSFNGDTVQLVDKFVKEVKKKNPKGIILDIRNNPGGLLDSAIDIASLWMNPDFLAMIEKFGDGREIRYNSNKINPLKSYKTVVLINEGSASGAEILAGALQDYKIAKLVGKKSFGKGSVQSLKKMPDGSSLKVTIAEWLTPEGRSINKLGIKPDIEESFTADDYARGNDPQLARAVELINGKTK